MVFIFSVQLEKIINVQRKSRSEARPVLKNKNQFKSGFSLNIDDFLKLHEKNKIENRKSGFNKFLEIPKAAQNRSKHSLKVPELTLLYLEVIEIFKNSKIWRSFWKSRHFSSKIFRFHRKLFLVEKKSENIFDSEKKYFFLKLKKKVGTQLWCRKFISFDWWGFQSDSGPLPRVRCKYVLPKLQESGHFRSLPANRVWDPVPPCQLWG